MDSVLKPLPWPHLFVLLGLYALPVAAAVRPGLDADLWWHLRVGEWIVEHRALPENDPFSQYGQDRPWVAYSWLFEVVLYGFYRALGVSGVFLFRALAAVLTVAACHRLLLRRQPQFLPGVLLLAVGVFILTRLLTERPWLFTIIGCALTLTTIVDLRDGRVSRSVWLLPLVFVLWANIHVQFIYGLALLGLACAVPGRDQPWGSVAWKRLVLLTALCTLATLVTPFHVHLYGVVIEYATLPAPFRLVQELKALEFRALGDWAVLGLALLTAFVLGRKAKLTAFDVLLLALAAFLTFRARRDSWMILLAALVILPPARTKVEGFTFPLSRIAVLLAGLAVVFTLLLLRPGFAEQVEQTEARTYPRQAVAEVKTKLAAGAIEGPLYNTFNWGGYLIWNLRELPVSIDGRTNLHGDERLERYSRIWHGSTEYENDTELDRAGVVIVERASALASLLRRDPRFEVMHEDETAIVFVRRRDGPASRSPGR